MDCVRAGVDTSGDVTVLFTDIEGSTWKWEVAAAVMGDALSCHDRLVDAAVHRNGGQVMKHTGDGVLACFVLVAEAVRAAIEVQHDIGEHDFAAVGGLRVRVGIDSGRVEHRNGDLFGTTVNRCARVTDAAHGGQVLLTDDVLARLEPAERVAEGVGTVDLGLHRLRGLGAPVRLHQLCHPTLAMGFPQLRTPRAVDGNLPAPVALLGRDNVARLIREGIQAERLVTLVGPGGVGKSSLAICIAETLRAEEPDGVWFVDLSVTDAGTDLVEVLGRVLGVQARPPDPLEVTLRDVLAARRMLVLLDNAEHVRDNVADLLSRVATPSGVAHFVVTSRVALGLADEKRFIIDPLATPRRIGVRDLGDVHRCPALRLFADRARQARPGYGLNEENLSAAAHICEQLDGLPLAIELAAARAELLSTAEIAALVTQRFRLLRNDVAHEHRHRTLTALLDWSFELLSDAAKVVFPSLGVFAGSFDLDGAATVCGLDVLDMLDVLTELAHSSLLVTESNGDGVRYSLLETIKEYAALHLASTLAEPEARRRHAQYNAELARTLFESSWTTDSVMLLERCHAGLADLRRAFVHLRDTDALEAVRMATDLYPLWLLRDAAAEGLRWLDEAIEACSAASSPIVVRALDDAGTLAWVIGDSAAAEERCRAAIRTAELIGAAPPPKAMVRLGVLRMLDGDSAAALSLCHRAHDIARESADPEVVNVIERTLGSVLALSGEVEQGAELCRHAVERARSSGLLWLVSALTNYAMAIHKIDALLAIRVALEAIEEARRVGSKYYEATARGGLAASYWALGQRESACRSYCDALRLMLDTGSKSTALIALDHVAEALLEVAPDVAVMLTSGSGHLQTGDRLWQGGRRERLGVKLDGRLTDDELDRAWREGGELTLDELGALAQATVETAFP